MEGQPPGEAQSQAEGEHEARLGPQLTAWGLGRASSSLWNGFSPSSSILCFPQKPQGFSWGGRRGPGAWAVLASVSSSVK